MTELQLPEAGTYQRDLMERWAWQVAQNWGLKITKVSRWSLLKGRTEALVFEGQEADVLKVEATWKDHVLAA